MLRALFDPLSSLIYPQQCTVCGHEADDLAGGVACRECWSATRLFNGGEMLCDHCGAYFGPTAPVPVRCHKCDDHLYDKAAAAGIYEKALAAAIIQLKNTPAFPSKLRDVIESACLPDDFIDADVIVPIPLSRQRRLERGYNQAEVIADALARRLKGNVDRQTLTRKIHTPIHRVGMDQKARELSVRNAFEVTRSKLIEGRNVLLVDDVLTSGATASYAAKVLKKGGAEKVLVFTLARAVMD